MPVLSPALPSEAATLWKNEPTRIDDAEPIQGPLRHDAGGSVPARTIGNLQLSLMPRLSWPVVVGTADGRRIGERVSTGVGARLGAMEGAVVGARVGARVGATESALVGALVAARVGATAGGRLDTARLLGAGVAST